MSNDWMPSKEDVKILCEAVLENYVSQDRNTGGDYCSQCGKHYGNVQYYWEEGKREPHNPNCPVLVAQDVMTGIG